MSPRNESSPLHQRRTLSHEPPSLPRRRSWAPTSPISGSTTRALSHEEPGEQNKSKRAPEGGRVLPSTGDLATSPPRFELGSHTTRRPSRAASTNALRYRAIYEDGRVRAFPYSGAFSAMPPPSRALAPSAFSGVRGPPRAPGRCTTCSAGRPGADEPPATSRERHDRATCKKHGRPWLCPQAYPQ